MARPRLFKDLSILKVNLEQHHKDFLSKLAHEQSVATGKYVSPSHIIRQLIDRLHNEQKAA